jgi:hypothetical protein
MELPYAYPGDGGEGNGEEGRLWARNKLRGPEHAVDVRGLALYYPDGELGESVLAVAPLEDGGVCLWDVAGTRGRRGAIIARSRPGLLFLEKRSSEKMKAWPSWTDYTECVSVDSGMHRAFFAVENGKLGSRHVRGDYKPLIRAASGG